MALQGKRKYDFKRIYVIVCSECNENIVERMDEDLVMTRADAEDYARRHEALHRSEDSAA